eukprot:6411055-Amphidinium_carterae.1
MDVPAKEENACEMRMMWFSRGAPNSQTLKWRACVCCQESAMEDKTGMQSSKRCIFVFNTCCVLT